MTANKGNCAQIPTAFMEYSLKITEVREYSSIQGRLEELEEERSCQDRYRFVGIAEQEEMEAQFLEKKDGLLSNITTGISQVTVKGEETQGHAICTADHSG